MAASQERRSEKRHQELSGDLRIALAGFAAESRGSCESRNLGLALELADRYRGFAGRSEEFKYLAESAGQFLDIADTAAEHGCPEMARDIYRAMIATYVGTGYAAHRQRAEIGLADLRARGR